MIDVTVRPSTREDNDTLTVGDTVYQATSAPDLFIPYTVVEIEQKTKHRKHPGVSGLVPESYPMAHLKSITGGETGTSSIDGHFMLDRFHVPCTPEHPEAINGQAFSHVKTLLTIRVESDRLDADGELARAIAVLEAAGFVQRRGCSARADTDVRQHVYRMTFHDGVRTDMPIGINVPHADCTYVAQEHGIASGYTTMIADPRIPVG